MSPEAYQRKLERNKKYRMGFTVDEELIPTPYVQTEKIKRPSLFEILDTLRKDNRHYLWGVKSILQWTEKDWIEFNKLKSA